jgi:hypothetical protein
MIIATAIIAIMETAVSKLLNCVFKIAEFMLTLLAFEEISEEHN